MREERLGPIIRFRCHIGHVMTAEVLAAAQAEMLEDQLATCLRMLNERVAMCAELAPKQAALGDDAARDAWRRASEEAANWERSLQALSEHQWRVPQPSLEQTP